MLPRYAGAMVPALLPLLVLAPLPQEAGVDFARDVRPILTQHCYACHGPDEAAREGDLRLDVEADARASGALDGELVHRVTLAADHPDRMPPAELGEPLSAEQAAVLAA